MNHETIWVVLPFVTFLFGFVTGRVRRSYVRSKRFTCTCGLGSKEYLQTHAVGCPIRERQDRLKRYG